jgi:quercetin dioxygenase-like cupin family protein
MDHQPAGLVNWNPAGSEHFTGDVWFGPMHSAAEADGVNVLGVSFAPGARSDWHTHPGGQVLHVLSGIARVQTEGGSTVTARPGDTVHAEPGEVHWHGASPDSPMIHLSITSGGPTRWLPRKVTDEEYNA